MRWYVDITNRVLLTKIYICEETEILKAANSNIINDVISNRNNPSYSNLLGTRITVSDREEDGTTDDESKMKALQGNQF